MPDKLPSLHTSFKVGFPPTKFNFILPSFAPKQEIWVTIGSTLKTGASGIITVTIFTQLFASIIVAV